MAKGDSKKENETICSEGEELEEITKNVLSKSKFINKISEEFEKNKNIDQSSLLQIGNELFYVLDKNNLSWVESFIVLSSLSSTITDMYRNKLNSLNINNHEKNTLLILYEYYCNDYNRKSHLITGLNCLSDGILGGKSYKFSSNPLYKTSSNLKKRFEILKKYGFRCVYCGRKAPEVSLELEHIVPKSKGGSDNFDNLVPACWECNRGKGSEPLF